MRSFLLMAGGLLLTTAVSAQTAAEAITAPVVTPPRLLHFSVGLGTGLQALHPTAGGPTRLAFTNGLTGIVALGNRYELETGVALTMGGRGGRNGGHHPRPDSATYDAGSRHHRGGHGGGMALTVPLKINAFIWSAGPLRAFVSGGVVTNLHGRRGGGCHGNDATTPSAATTTTSETTTSTTTAPRVAVAATAGFGLEYRPCGSLSLRIEPQGRFDLQAAGRSWGGGLRIGTYWNF